MNHYQEQFKCSVCSRVLIVDIFSFGVTHQNIEAVTCLECAKRVKGNILGNTIEEIDNNLKEVFE